MGSIAAADVPSITRSELIDALSRGRLTLVDVLSPESYAAAHIERAINLPVVEIPTRATELLPDRTAPIVVYCGGPT